MSIKTRVRVITYDEDTGLVTSHDVEWQMLEYAALPTFDLLCAIKRNQEDMIKMELEIAATFRGKEA